MIKDTMQLQGFPTMKIPKIKGTVEIKLHNPTTGKTVIERGENMVTDAVSDIFASNYCGALNYRNFLPLYEKMFGGVLCFNEQLTVSGEGAEKDYYIPDEHTLSVTAHAGQTAFSSQSDDLKRGAPSDANMSVTDGVVTLAWEWGLSAGNGTIASLALTHADVGDAGTGSTSQAFQALQPCINASFGLPFTHNVNINNMVLFVGSDGYGYRFWTEGRTLTITKIPLLYEKTGLVAPPPFTDSDLNETYTITTDTNFQYRPYYCYDKETHKLWLFNNSSAGGTNYANVEEVNLSTYEATNRSSSFTNLGVNVGPLYNYFPLQAPYANGFVYLRKPKTTGQNYQCNGFLRIQLSNPANRTELSALVVPHGGVFDPGAANKLVAGKTFVVNTDAIGTPVLYPCSYTADYWNATAPDNVSVFPFTEDRTGLAKLGGLFVHNNSGQVYYVAVSKFYLATKYNLASAVQKTASQSMIVTYTLQEVAPNE